jgi:hypothetical protein
MRNLWAEAAARGVHPSRIVFAPRRPRAQHLYRHYAADIALDTGVYGAHTTTADALYVGLPSVTRAGASFASRVGASLLRAAGSAAASTTATHSHAEYEDVAVALARRPRALAALRRELADTVGATVARETQPGASRFEPAAGPAPAHDLPMPRVYEAAGFARGMEAAARTAFEVRELALSGAGGTRQGDAAAVAPAAGGERIAVGPTFHVVVPAAIDGR